MMKESNNLFLRRNLLFSIIFLYLLSFPATSKSQNLLYAKALNNSVIQGGDVNGRGVVTDASGNIYVAGSYSGIADFDPGPAALNVRGSGGTDIFLAKYRSDGSLDFVKSIGYTLNEDVNNISIDAAGNIYICGLFSGSVDFDPGPGVATLTTVSSSQDIFIAKYDALGNYVYARALSSNSGKQCFDVAVDASGYVCITGDFQNTLDFDPGPGTANLTSAGNTDMFVARYDVNGNYVYAIRMGAASTDEGYSIAVDASGNAYVTGYYRGTVDFDPGAGTATLPNSVNTDMFLAAYDVNGNYLFAKNLSGTGNEEGNSIALDASSNIYLTGTFSGTVDFDPGAGVVNVNSNSGSSDIFLAKYDALGNYLFAKAIGGSGIDRPYCITLDASGNSFLTGYFNGTADFDPSGAVANLTTNGSSDVYVAAYDASGVYLYARKMGGINPDMGYGIAIDASGNTVTTGFFSGTADFDPGGGIVSLSITGTGLNAFVTKLDNVGGYSFANQIGVYPNPGYADNGKSICVDAFGNTYVIGSFAGTVDFDPGPGTAYLTSAGSFDIFFAKYDAIGNFQYANRIGGTGNDNGICIVVDALGNAYVTGFFSATVDLDPGPGTVNVSSSGGSNDIFFGKYDASGNYLFAKTIGSTSSDQGFGLTVDASGNIYVTGFFVGTVDFDPGVGVASLTGTGATADIFFAKYDAAGNYLLAKSMGSTSVDHGISIAVDASSNIYITGTFDGTVDFDPGAGVANLIGAGGGDMYFAKYDASGNYVFAKKAGSTAAETGKSIKVDGSGNIYLTGSFGAAVDFDPGIATVNLVSAGGADIFIAKYDGSGNLIYAKGIGGTGIDNGYSLDIDNAGNAYAAGTFFGTADFDPGAGVANITSAGLFDAFIVKLDALGNFVNAKAMGSLFADDGAGIAVDASGNIYVTGYFQHIGDFDQNDPAPSTLIEANNNNDIFIAKYGPFSSLPVRLLSFSVTPIKNGEAAQINWSTELEINNDFYEIERSNNGREFELFTRVPGCRYCNGIQRYSVEDNQPYPGISFYRLKQTDVDKKVAYSKVVKFSINQTAYFKIFPTIFTHSFNLDVKNHRGKGSYTLEMLNATGSSVMLKRLWLNEGEQNLDINFGSSANGIYYVRICDSEGKTVFTSRVIKQDR